MDKIYLQNLEVFAHHGYYEYEREMGQKFIINAVFTVDLKDITEEERNRTISFSDAVSFIYDYTTSHMYKLVEVLADKLAAALLEKYPQVHSVNIKISKPQEPIRYRIDYPTVEVERSR